MSNKFSVTLTKNPKAKPNPDNLKFGRTFTDHMFLMDYTPEKGWHDGRIVPYAPLELDPACTVFHYGQEMFEGLKAYKTKEGKVQLFRPDMNAKRTNNTNQRMCMPQMDEELFVDAVKAVVDVDRDWIPQKENTALYIRPFIIATQPKLGKICHALRVALRIFSGRIILNSKSGKSADFLDLVFSYSPSRENDFRAPERRWRSGAPFLWAILYNFSKHFLGNLPPGSFRALQNFRLSGTKGA